MTGLILLIALIGFVRLNQAIVQWQFLSGLEGVSPIYLLSTGMLWGLFALITGLLLWLRWNQSNILVPAFFFSFSCYYWFDRLFMAKSPDRQVNWPFMLLLNLVALGWVFLTFQRPKVRQYLSE